MSDVRNDIWVYTTVNTPDYGTVKVYYIPAKYYNKLNTILNIDFDYETHKFQQMKQDFNRIDRAVVDGIEESFFSEIANIISCLDPKRSYRPYNILRQIQTELHHTLNMAWRRIIEEELILVTKNGWYKKNPEINYHSYLTKKV